MNVGRNKNTGLAKAMTIGVALLMLFSTDALFAMASADVTPMYVPPEGICGYVYDSTTQRALSGVTVTVTNFGTATTNAQGYWAKYTGTGGSFTVSLSKTGFNVASDSITISSQTGWGSKNINMARNPDYYTGFVTNYTSGVGISGATVKFQDTSDHLNPQVSQHTYYATTDETGFYQLSNDRLNKWSYVLNAFVIKVRVSAGKAGSADGYWSELHDTSARLSFYNQQYDFRLLNNSVQYVVEAACFFTNPGYGVNNNVSAIVDMNDGITQTTTITFSGNAVLNLAGQSVGLSGASSQTYTESISNGFSGYNLTADAITHGYKGVGIERKIIVSGVTYKNSNGNYIALWEYMLERTGSTRFRYWTSDPESSTHVANADTFDVMHRQVGQAPMQTDLECYLNAGSTESIGLNVGFTLPLGVVTGGGSAGVSFTVTRSHSSTDNHSTWLKLMNSDYVDYNWWYYSGYGSATDPYGPVLHVWVS